MTPDDLDVIFIRAKNKHGIFIRAKNKHGKWGSYSLRELLDDGVGGQIGAWYGNQWMRMVGLEEMSVVTPESVRMMIAVLEKAGFTIGRLKEPQPMSAINDTPR